MGQYVLPVQRKSAYTYPGGGGALSIYTGRGVPQHIKKGGS